MFMILSRFLTEYVRDENMNQETLESYWISVRYRKFIVIWNKKHQFALSGQIVLEEAMALSQDKLRSK